MRIGAAAKLLGVSRDSLRRWEKSGNLDGITRSAGGHRYYSLEVDENGNLQEFGLGELVSLKSGGPTMTIHAIRGDDLTCRWFDGTNLAEHTFTLDMIARPDAL